MKTTIGILVTAFALVLFPHQIYSQAQKAEQLIAELDTISIDTVKVRQYYRISLYLRNTQPERHRHFVEAGLELSQTIGNKKYESTLLQELGIHFRKRGQLDSALHYYQLARQAATHLPDSTIYFGVGSSMAQVLKSQGAYQESAALFIDAIRYFESIGTERSRHNVLIARFNLSGLYLSMSEYPKAAQLLQEIEADSLAHKHPNLIRKLYINLMATYIKLDALDTALHYGKKAESMVRRVGSGRSLANVYNNMGSIHEKKAQWTEAREYFEKAHSQFVALKDQPGTIKTLNNLGNLYTKEGHFPKALERLLEARQLLEQGGNIYSLRHNYEMLISAYHKLDEHEAAFQTQQKLMHLKDSILGIEQRQGIERLKTEYETEKKEMLLKQANQEKELAQLSASKERSRLIQGSALGGTLLLSLAFYLRLFKAKKQKQLLSLELNYSQQQRKLEADYNNAELKAIKAQMNPHFLFNAMSSVQGLILDNKKKEACTYLARLSAMVRKNLELTARQYVEAREELELIETYLKLEQMRLGKSFHYQLTGAEQLKAIQLPAMIIQPFLENAIKHGLLHKPGTKSLRISFELKEVLLCTITDNGVGREKAEAYNSQFKKQHQSFSTEAIRRRFELLQEESESSLGFETQDIVEQGQALGTQVVLRMPFKPENDE